MAAFVQPRPSVLLVDDVDANLLALEAQLGNLDCDLVRARNGNEALRQLLRRPFAVMLLDVQMPDMDGYEVAHHARQNSTTRDVPIIFLTAMHRAEESSLRGYGAGAVDLLFKPVSSYILRSKVQVFLDLFRSRRALADEVEAHQKTLADLEAFNHSVSHDLRAPLRPLDGFSRALLDDYGEKLDAQARGYLRRISAAALRMSQLIDDLLQLSRMGRAAVKPQPVDLSALVTSILDDLRANDGGRRVDTVVEPGAFVEGDVRLLRIALENLLRNAWKFTQRRPCGRIQFGRGPAAPEAAYYVRDDGVGFDPSYAGRLFQPFQRLHAASDFEGTGIGLAIVNRIVQRHGGRIWAESAPDQGATFWFTLPSAPAPAAPGEVPGTER